MVTITLTPELEQAVVKRAQQQGTTPEIYLLDDLRERFLPDSPAANKGDNGETMADFFEGYAGTVNTREIVPGGANLSKETGKKFKEIMVEKYRSSKP